MTLIVVGRKVNRAPAIPTSGLQVILKPTEQATQRIEDWNQ
jgi:hypothetical protein